MIEQPASLILDAVLTKLIPWSIDGTNRTIISSERMLSIELPFASSLTKHPLKGKRTAIRGKRRNQNTWLITAHWPQLGLNETNAPKIACVLAGEVNFRLGNYSISCGAGRFIFIPPNLPHPDGTQNITDTNKSTFCRVLYILQHHSALQCWVSHYTDETPPLQIEQNCLIKHEHAVSLFRIIAGELTSGDINIGKELLSSFFRIVAREIKAGHVQSIPHTPENRSMIFSAQGVENFPRQLDQYLQSHLYERPTVEDAAKYFYYSRAQFSRYVRAETGKTFIEILNEHRIATAKELLRESNWTIANIAELIGYRSPHYFHTLFRKHVGMTPTEYRQSLIQIDTKN